MSKSDFEIIKQLIRSRLIEIEAQNNIKIVYDCESGSRAWGFPSANSDYDVRFIYVRPIEWYLSIDEKRDVIEHPIDEQLDING
jgi:predicted nucleotidyltransferase